jgi:hypothetical protein
VSGGGGLEGVTVFRGFLQAEGSLPVAPGRGDIQKALLPKHLLPMLDQEL